MKTLITKIPLIVLICSYFTSFGQEISLKEPDIKSPTYKTAFGLRAGETSGLTFKQFIGKRNAIEGIAGIWYHGISATILYEQYAPAFSVDRMYWYYGVGGHVSAQSSYVYYHNRHYRYERFDEGSVGIGVDAIFGLEYKIPSTPIAMSFDFKPYAEVISTGGFWMSLDPGVGFKIAF